MSNTLNAAQAITTARQFLMEPGRFSGWLRTNSTDIVLKNLDLLEEVQIEGYYPKVSGDTHLPIKLESQKVCAWLITFSIRKFSGKAAVQVFCVKDEPEPMAKIFYDTINPSFLYRED